MKKWKLLTYALIAVLLVLIPWQIVTSQSLYTMRTVFNRVFDKSTNTLHLDTWSGPSAADPFLTEIDILNKVFDPVGNKLNTSGGAGGINISGTPVAGQYARWFNANTLESVVLAGGGDALVANPLSQFAATTSAQLAAVLSDEVGVSGGFVRSDQLTPLTSAPYLTNQAVAGLSAEVNLGALTTGLLKHTVSGSVSTPATAIAGTDYVAPAGNVATATALAADPADCTGNNFAIGIVAAGTATCAQPAFSNLSGSATTAQITDDAVTFAKMQNIATATLIGNNSGSTGDPLALTAAQAKTLLALNNVDNTADINKNVGTAAALTANGANCAVAGAFGNGVDAAGVSENCVTLSAVNAQTGTYQVLVGDFDRYKTITVASGTFTITLVAVASQPADGKYIDVINYGSGVVTIARVDQNLNGGVSSLVVPAGSATAPTGAKIISNGSVYFGVLFGAGGGGGGSGTVSSSTDNYAARYNGTGTTVGGSSGLQLSTTAIKTKKDEVTLISTNTTLGQHNIVGCTSGSGTVTSTLPSASSTTVGEYTVTKVDSGVGTCDVARAGSDTLNGLAGSISLTRQWDSTTVRLYDAGSPGNWHVTTAKAQLGYHQLSVQGAKLPSTNAAVIDQSESRPKLVFDASVSWCASWTFQLNPDYGTLPVLRFSYAMASATTGSFSMGWSVWKTTSGEAADGQTESYDTVNTCTDSAVPGTAGRIEHVACSLTNADSMVANDVVTLRGCRDIADTATGNAEVMAMQLQYIKN